MVAGYLCLFPVCAMTKMAWVVRSVLPNGIWNCKQWNWYYQDWKEELWQWWSKKPSVQRVEGKLEFGEEPRSIWHMQPRVNAALLAHAVGGGMLSGANGWLLLILIAINLISCGERIQLYGKYLRARQHLAHDRWMPGLHASVIVWTLYRLGCCSSSCLVCMLTCMKGQACGCRDRRCMGLSWIMRLKIPLGCLRRYLILDSPSIPFPSWSFSVEARMSTASLERPRFKIYSALNRVQKKRSETLLQKLNVCLLQ